MKFTKANLVLVILFIAFVTVGSTYLTYNLNKNIKTITTREYDMYVTVVNTSKVGFNVQTDALYFGKVPNGYSSSTRSIEMKNDHPFPIYIDMRVEGKEFKEWTTFNQYKGALNSGENQTIKLSVIVPENTTTGNYSGKLFISLRK